MTPSIQTFTGRLVYPLDLRPDDVDIVDIAHSLALQCRFTGHCEEFYSVAEHSVRVCDCVDDLCNASPEFLLCALLHDASEAYLTDLPRPLKHATEMGVLYMMHEERATEAIMKAFGLPDPLTSEIDMADSILLSTEKRDVMPPSEPWPYLPPPLAEEIEPWSWHAAEERFLERFRKLNEARG